MTIVKVATQRVQRWLPRVVVHHVRPAYGLGHHVGTASSRSFQRLHIVNSSNRNSSCNGTLKPWLTEVLYGNLKLHPTVLTNPLFKRTFSSSLGRHPKRMTKGRRFLSRLRRAGGKTGGIMMLLSAPFLSMGYQAAALEPANYCESDPFACTEDRSGVVIENFDEALGPLYAQRPRSFSARRNSGIAMLQLLKPSSYGPRQSRSLSNSLSGLLNKAPTVEHELSDHGSISTMLLPDHHHHNNSSSSSSSSSAVASSAKTTTTKPNGSTKQRPHSARKPILRATSDQKSPLGGHVRRLDVFDAELEQKLRPGLYNVFDSCLNEHSGRFVMDKKSYADCMAVVKEFKQADVYVWKALNQYLERSSLIISVRIQDIELLDSHLLALSCSSKAFRGIRAITLCNNYLGITQDARGLDALLLSLAKSSERLEAFTLIRNSLADCHAPLLSRFISRCHALTKLSLCWNAFSDASVKIFAGMLTRRRKGVSSTTRRIDLSYNQISQNGKQRLLDVVLENTELKV